MIKKFKEVDNTLPTKEDLKLLQSGMKGSNGRRVLRSLFLETLSDSVVSEEIQPIFTLKDTNIIKDGKVYYSLKNIYFSYDHIPGYEYEFAKDVFNSWEHWCMLCDGGGFVPVNIQQWRDEYTIMIQAKAFKALAKTAMYEGSKGTPAARFLADKGWETKRGRPTTAEVERERKIAAGVSKEVQEDMDRLGLVLVK